MGALVGAAIVCAGAPTAFAGPDQSDAQILFEQGRKALDRGDEATACTKFEESLRLARSAGPLFNLAMCEEHKTHLVEAARNWREALSLVPPDDPRVEPAWERLAALDKKLGRLTISLPVDTPAGADLLLDGVEVPQRAAKEGSAGAREPGLVIEVAPGDHKVELDVRGRDPATAKVTVAAGENKDIALAWPKSSNPDEQPDPQPDPKPDPDPKEKDTPDSGRGVRVAGFVLGGVGLATTIVGAATGILTILKKGEVEDNCTSTCNDAARDAATDGKAFSIASSVTFPTGLAMTAVGAILVFTHLPSSDEKAKPAPVTALLPIVSPSYWGLSFAGTL
ncbi:MAG: hypothetical protein U0414_15270 [Polyangiaceae bacterium]